jgi:hypothetical protein
MFSVRKTTKFHGNANFIVLIYILLITSILITFYGINYLVIFLSSSLVHLLIETGLTISNIRKGSTYLYGRKLSKPSEIILRSFVEGPAFCVPAFFIADQFIAGNVLPALTSATFIVGIAAFYLAYSDNFQLRKIKTDEDVIISRRAMTKPKSVMLLALINTICISMMFLIPLDSRYHAFAYLLSYSLFVVLFYFINYNMRVRYIELYDPETMSYKKPGVLMQVSGLLYDSAYEMSLLISPAYWIPYYMGGFS